MINKIDYLFIGVFLIHILLNLAPLMRARLEASFIKNKGNEVLVGLAPLALWLTYYSALRDTIIMDISFAIWGPMFLYIYAVAFSILKNRVIAYNKSIKQD